MQTSTDAEAAVAFREDETLTTPIVFFEGSAVATLLSGMHQEFPRPATKLNRLIAHLASRLPEQRLTPAKIREWLDDSLEVFSQLVDDPAALELVRQETAWLITDARPPDPDVWSGECKFVEGKFPVVACYTKTLASRLPGAAHELAWQGSMDHFVGHLYPFFRGAEDPDEYGEEVACRYQHLAAQYRAKRDRRFGVIACLMPLTYRLHKRIPLANYASL